MEGKREETEKGKRRWRWIVGGAGLLLLLLVIDYFAYPYGAPPSGRTFNTGENGLWLRYTWYFGQKSDAYFGQTAALCDQITVMCYDSGFWLPRSYVWLVRQQAIHVTHAVARSHPSCRVLLGVPTYRAGGLSHNARAENLGLALRGVCEGMSDPRADMRVFAGVAPFADYTTGPEDWETYRALWLQR